MDAVRSEMNSQVSSRYVKTNSYITQEFELERLTFCGKKKAPPPTFFVVVKHECWYCADVNGAEEPRDTTLMFLFCA